MEAARLLILAGTKAIWAVPFQPDFAERTSASNIYASWHDSAAVRLTDRFDLCKDSCALVGQYASNLCSESQFNPRCELAATYSAGNPMTLTPASRLHAT
jgi:hypothetical protein